MRSFKLISYEPGDGPTPLSEALERLSNAVRAYRQFTLIFAGSLIAGGKYPDYFESTGVSFLRERWADDPLARQWMTEFDSCGERVRANHTALLNDILESTTSFAKLCPDALKSATSIALTDLLHWAVTGDA